MIAINGDALFDFPLAPFLERHQERGAMATLILRRVPRGSPFGRVGVGPEDRIHVIAEIEGPKAHEHPLVYSAYTGVQIFNTQLMQLVPDEPCDILRTAHRALLERGVPVFGDFAPDDGVWLDVGTLERYLDAHSAFLDGRLSTPGLPPADLEGRRISATADIDGGAVLSGPCAVLDGACIEGGAHVGPGTFVGRRAHIYPGVELTGCVVWDGVEVRRSARDEVFIPEG
jgi:NDP-sugar pyrophosphorylase family protein